VTVGLFLLLLLLHVGPVEVHVKIEQEKNVACFCEAVVV
jgi:hypothetical protein